MEHDQRVPLAGFRDVQLNVTRVDETVLDSLDGREAVARGFHIDRHFAGKP
jgi:hypothetical protein